MGDKPTATVSALLAIGTNPDLSVAYDILSHLTGNERWLDFKKVADDR